MAIKKLPPSREKMHRRRREGKCIGCNKQAEVNKLICDSCHQEYLKRKLEDEK